MSDSSTEASGLIRTFLLQYENARTRRAYRSDLRQFFGSDPVHVSAVRGVDRSDVEAHLEKLKDRDRSPATIRRRLSTLGTFFDWLERIELIDRHPARAAELPDTGSSPSGSAELERSGSPVVGLRPGQIERLLRATDEAGEARVRDRALILVLVYGMLRRSDAARMDVRHVEIGSEFAVIDLSGVVDRPFRPIRLPAVVSEAVESVVSRYGIVDGPLWRSLSRNHTRGDRLSPDGIYRMVRRTAERVGLTEGIGAQTLRQTGCVLALRGGATPRQIADHAGYRSVDTARRYESEPRSHRASAAADYVDLGI